MVIAHPLRRLLLLVPAAWLAGIGCKREPVMTEAFRIHLSYTRGESSKDSHSYRYQCKVEGSLVEYHGPYGDCDRGLCDHKTVTFSISAAEQQELLNLVQTHGLLSSFEETKSTDGLGNYVHLEWAVAQGSAEGKTLIRGMTFSHQPSADELSDDAVQRIRSVDKLRSELAKLAGPHLPGAL